jgi:hypothetical protein
MVVWLWLCGSSDGGQCGGPHVVFPQARLVEVSHIQRLAIQVLIKANV